ncbi:MAG: hypothetical protein D6814_14410, partial [Calditrichaeota bacterium]
MRRYLWFFLPVSLLWLALSVHSASSQGIMRSNGLGLRFSFWNMPDQHGQFNFSTGAEGSTVEISGIGTWLNFYSRAHRNWFLEMNLGVVGTLNTRTGQAGDNVTVSAIIPFLFGLRNYLFASRFTGSFQPYATLGGGPYWTTSVIVKNNTAEGLVFGNADQTLGWYAGGGMNLLLRSWFSLDFDVKYHHVKFNQVQDNSGFEFGLGFSLIWGRKPELFHVQQARLIVRDIYPAYFPFYRTYPVALVTVKNLTGHRIELGLQSRLEGFSSAPANSLNLNLKPGEVRDIPVKILLGHRWLQVRRRKLAILHIQLKSGTQKKDIS